MRVNVIHTLDDLAADAARSAGIPKRRLPGVVRENINEGNRIAKAFASEQHTMFGDEDITYPPSFTAEMKGALSGEYGPDSSIGDGSQAEGYEHGSINSPPHNDMGRSFDAIRVEFRLDVEDVAREMFW